MSFWFALFLVTSASAIYLGVRLAIQTFLRSQAQRELSMMRDVFERSGLRLPGELPSRLESDSSPTGSWTGQPLARTMTRPPGTSQRWDEVRPR